MTKRREKVRQQALLNKQLTDVQATSSNDKKEKIVSTWRANLGKYLIDISKYVVTGVMITSIFKDIDDKGFIYLLSFIIALVALIVGLVLTNKKVKE